MPKTEFQRIEKLARTLARDKRGVLAGIGDDAAVLEIGGESIVLTVDAQVAGTHFRPEWLSFEDIGWRAVMAAASDLAAMGADAWCALSSLVLTRDISDAELDAFAKGEADACDALDACIVGGNLARGEQFSITIAWLGRSKRPITRSGAKAGDTLWLAGDLGLSAAGLLALSQLSCVQALEVLDIDAPALAPAIASWRRPRARLKEGLAMAALAHAAIDVSDGLAQDAHHVAKASGVRIALDPAALVTPNLEAAARSLARDPLDLALHGGEDYALLAAAGGSIPGFRAVGEVLSGSGVCLRSGGGEIELEPRGFDHFSGWPGHQGKLAGPGG